MINFWATWCGPCRKEMPDIVAADLADDDLVVLAINVQEELAAIEPFVEEFGMTMPIGRDASGELRTLYEAAGMPTSVFIQPDGTVAIKWSGLLTPELLDNFLGQIRSTS
jgi:thiol-disulfide isomerase/thioredoxin